MSEAADFSKASIARDLTALGLKRGDVVLMHSDLRRLAAPRDLLAAPDAGMQWLIEAFRDVLKSDGILAVPTFTCTFKDASEGPAGEVFNPAKTPSRVGQITNYVLGLTDRKRSDHPTHSVAAIGDGAEAFVSGHSWRDGATTFDRDGPWGHLADADGYILWLGTGMRTQTCVHVVEDWMRLPYMCTCTALVQVDGETREVEVTQSPAGPRDFYKRESKVSRAWDAAGLDTRGTVCRADCRLMRAAVFIDWLWDALLEEPCLLLNDDATDEFTVTGCRETARHVQTAIPPWRRG